MAFNCLGQQMTSFCVVIYCLDTLKANEASEKNNCSRRSIAVNSIPPASNRNPTARDQWLYKEQWVDYRWLSNATHAALSRFPNRNSKWFSSAVKKGTRREAERDWNLFSLKWTWTGRGGLETVWAVHAVQVANWGLKYAKQILVTLSAKATHSGQREEEKRRNNQLSVKIWFNRTCLTLITSRWM